jgi:hypothetical protein
MTTPPSKLFGTKDSARNLIFTILTKEYPLKTIELMNLIRKRYGRSITFQATRQAALQLVEDGILERVEERFQIRKEWVVESKQFLNDLYDELQNPKTQPSAASEASDDVNVYTFESVNALLLFWEDLITEWGRKRKSGDRSINCYQTFHIWEVLLHPDLERRTMSGLHKRGVTSYAVCMGNTPLDRVVCRFYNKIGIKTVMSPSQASFDKGYTVATYGELIVQVQYPQRFIKELDAFFKSNTTMEDLELQRLSQIVNRKTPVKLTVIRNPSMAQQINASITKLIL